MKWIRSRIGEFYHKHTPSIRVPMLLFVVAACMIPLLIQGRLIAQSSRQMQVERRIIDVQNQPDPEQ